MGTAGSHATRHNLPLDSVRGIAALCVVVHHIVISTTFTQAFDLGGPLADFFANGWIFVDLFFVLSGIVMAMTYVRPAERFSVRVFVVRRLARIYPLHLAVLLAWIPIRLARFFAVSLGIGAGAALVHDVNTPYAFLMQLFLLNAFGTLSEMSWNGPSWSISAELFAYAVFAVTVALLARHARSGMIGGAFAVISGLSLFTAVVVLRERELDFHLHFGVVRGLYGFSLGVVTMCAAEALRSSGVQIGGTWQSLCLAVALVYVALVGAYPWIGFIAPLAFAALLGGLVVSPETSLGRALSSAPLVWLGRRSYSIYMVHAFVIIIAGVSVPGLRARPHSVVEQPDLWRAVGGHRSVNHHHGFIALELQRSVYRETGRPCG